MYQGENRKIVLIGTGMVGMSYAYALLNQNVCDELVLIDIDKKRAMGEAMDLSHGLAFSGSNMKISAGDYPDCANADIVCICAGVAQKPGESRTDLLLRNAQVFRSIINPVTESGFNGLFLVATNPVDIMTRITCTLSGFNPRRVIGTGTTLDTARLRYLLGRHFGVDPRNMHAYVMGEHGDSEFVPWSLAMLASQSVLELCGKKTGTAGRQAAGKEAAVSDGQNVGKEVASADGQAANKEEETAQKESFGKTDVSAMVNKNKDYGSETENGSNRNGQISCNMQDLLSIENEVRNAAYRIIEAKNATYYGIGMAMTRITRAIFGNENSVLTVSAMLRGEYGQNRVFTGVPAIIGSNGIARVLELPLDGEEQKKLDESCEKLKSYYEELKLE